MQSRIIFHHTGAAYADVPSMPESEPSESAPLLSCDARHGAQPTQQCPNEPDLLSELFGTHPTPLSRALLAVSLLLLVLTSVFIGLYAGTQSKLNRTLHSPHTVTRTFNITDTVFRTLISTRTVTRPPPTPSPATVGCVHFLPLHSFSNYALGCLFCSRLCDSRSGYHQRQELEHRSVR